MRYKMINILSIAFLLFFLASVKNVSAAKKYLKLSNLDVYVLETYKGWKLYCCKFEIHNLSNDNLEFNVTIRVFDGFGFILAEFNNYKLKIKANSSHMIYDDMALHDDVINRMTKIVVGVNGGGVFICKEF